MPPPGPGCQTPPGLPPPNTQTPNQYTTPEWENAPLTYISNLKKSSGNIDRANCADAFAAAWDKLQTNPFTSTTFDPYAALVSLSTAGGAGTICRLETNEVTYAIDPSAIIKPSDWYLLDAFSITINWTAEGALEPWRLTFTFGGIVYAIPVGLGSIELALPPNYSAALSLVISANTTPPPVACPPPVNERTAIGPGTTANFKLQPTLLQTNNNTTAPPPPPPTIIITALSGMAGIIGPPLGIGAGP